MAFQFLARWLGQSSQRRRDDLHVVVFTRDRCPLCDEAWELLTRYQSEYGFSLSSQNVDESAELVREHGQWVPVIAINGRVRFRGHVNEVLLRRILDAG